MSAQNKVGVDDTVGATNSAPRSIVDLYVYGFLFPGNYWRTLAELREISEQKELKKGDMLKLKLLATLLVEQLLGQGAVNSVRVLELMEEYIRFNKSRGD
jgi:hypothetical protein